MFRKTIFELFLDVKLVFNGPLCHNILLREVEKGRKNTISFKFLGEKVSFEREDYDIITGLRYRPRREIWAYEAVSFINVRVAHRESSSAIPLLVFILVV
ncbi:Ulp1-like peptidase [Cucumis melo var. makuwa]|uniref:Ulp1-like peptidase n=1 Tax=Cucumis melo var. makuwa TaxID=1194695 RepID=A0A5D3DHX3_CUCMM|nr:Ulp1-like peptidase [Cucumis melo var. makuwa]